jgi:hypothetical protein
MPFVARRLVASVLSLSVAIQASGMTMRQAIWAAHGP